MPTRRLSWQRSLPRGNLQDTSFIAALMTRRSLSTFASMKVGGGKSWEDSWLTHSSSELRTCAASS